MSTSAKMSKKQGARVLGTRTFAAITAVEGLRLSASSRRRLDMLKASSLSPEERRAEVLRTYSGLAGKK